MNDRNEENGNEYSKVCYVCRRPESKAGPMITMPGGIDICRDCMQRAFDSVTKSGMDLSKLSGITPEQLWNGGMPAGMWQMPPTKPEEEKKTGTEEKEPIKDNKEDKADTEDDDIEDAEASESSEDAEDAEDAGDEDKDPFDGGFPWGNMGWGIPIGQIDLGAITGKKKVSKGVRGMPRLLEAKKDVVSCEKSRGFANEN